MMMGSPLYHGHGREARDTEKVLWLADANKADTQKMWDETRRLVRLHRGAVERVAQALLDKVKLEGDEIDDLVW
jgi:ATP-dependent Zn protease